MEPSKCPPLELDPELARMIDEYRRSKAAASATRSQASRVEREGHYDKDTPLQTRTAQEGEALAAERAAAVRLADRLIAWVDERK